MLTELDNDALEGGLESQTIFNGTGTDLEDNAFFSRFEEERESMRIELSSYLKTLREISGSDGKKLVSIPENFDDISDAMNRGENREHSA